MTRAFNWSDGSDGLLLHQVSVLCMRLSVIS
jgi:UDP-N-acetylmuramyl pentapeptide phosphotransferase/UDP-N-acetylglucosamine-1-phosphate transferase